MFTYFHISIASTQNRVLVQCLHLLFPFFYFSLSLFRIFNVVCLIRLLCLCVVHVRPMDHFVQHFDHAPQKQSAILHAFLVHIARKICTTMCIINQTLTRSVSFSLALWISFSFSLTLNSYQPGLLLFCFFYSWLLLLLLFLVVVLILMPLLKMFRWFYCIICGRSRSVSFCFLMHT